ncbi:glycoside hydrolase family protein [Pragia fontium]
MLTIGYGHIEGVRCGDIITAIEAEQLLKVDLVKFERDVTQLVRGH